MKKVVGYRKGGTNMPWYKQTAVWGLVISVLALSLSQLPPIANWRARTDVGIELGKRVGLPNTIGMPGYQLFIELRNKGNRTIELSKLRLKLKYPNNTSKLLYAQTYQKIIPGQFSPLDFPVTTINLAPGTNWTEQVSFHPELSPEDDEHLAEIRLQMSASIQQQAMKNPQTGPVEAAADIVDRANKFFDRNFDLQKGQYRVSLLADVNGEERTLRDFSFTLYDYHKNTIISQKKDFRFGWGITFPVLFQKQVWAQISNVEQ
ncbi:MAG: hypothetical protein ACOY5W_00855 [Pseudomonadota bacterium]